jgi:outer membrane protein
MLACTSAALAEPRALTVEDAVRAALANNRQVGAIRSRGQAADAVAKSARGRLLFPVNVSDEWQYWDSPFAIAFGGASFLAREQKTNTLVIGANQPLLGLLRRWEEKSAATHNAEAAAAGVATAEAAVREAVRAGYLRYFEARATADIARASEKELADQITVAESKIRAGVLTNADLLRIKVAAANARQQEIAADGQSQVERAGLLVLLGLSARDADVEFVEPTELLRAAEPPPDLAALDSRAVERRPELRQARLAERSADDERWARTFSLLPEVDLEASYLHVTGQVFLPKDSGFVGIRAGWPVWEWGASWFAQRAAAAQALAATRDRDEQQAQIGREVAARLAVERTAAAAVESAEAAIASAEEAYRVTQVLLQAGSATTTDLLSSQEALTQARLNLTRARYEQAIARVALVRATGD